MNLKLTYEAVTVDCFVLLNVKLSVEILLNISCCQRIYSYNNSVLKMMRINDEDLT